MREMKDSGIEWIGLYPSRFQITKFKYLFHERNMRTATGKEILLSVSQHKGVIPTSELSQKTMQAKSLVGYKKVFEGDLVFNKLNPVLARFGCSKYDGITSPDFSVYYSINKADMRYMSYLLRTDAYVTRIGQLTAGVGEGFSRLYTPQLYSICLAAPKIDEQKRIANYLDQKCSEIDAITKDIQAQIDTLEQYKRSVITEAVTKGLDPDVEMKDSGIEWIGKIPKNWKTAKLKYAIGMLTDYTANGSFADLAKNVEYHDFEDHARLIRLTDLRENLNNPGVYVNNEAYNYLSKSKLFGGEVLVANVGAYAGLFCEMPVIDRPATLGPNMFLIRANGNITNHFLFYIGNSFIVCEQLSQKAFSAAQPKLNKTDVKTIHLIIPPKEEQQIITTFLDNKCSEVDILIKDKQQQLSTLSDYKKSLIYEYVTGKKEVPAE